MKTIAINSSNALSPRDDHNAWRAVLNAFLNTLDSPATRREYTREIEIAMNELGDLASLAPVQLTEYRGRIVARMDVQGDTRLSSSSVMRHLAAVRSFLRFCRLTGQLRITDEVIRFALKSPKATVVKPYQVLTEIERSHLLGVARTNLRDRVLLEFALTTGLRAAEICAVCVGDLHVDGQGDLILRVRQGKGRKDRLVPLSDDTAVAVRSYLLARKLKLTSKSDAKEFLFPSRNGRGHGRLSTRRLRSIVAQYIKAAEIGKPISPHSLRHTAAMTWLNRDAPVPAVQKLLGHASLATTQKYVDHLGLEALKAVVNGA